jgi:hypothetical protein
MRSDGPPVDVYIWGVHGVVAGKKEAVRGGTAEEEVGRRRREGGKGLLATFCCKKLSMFFTTFLLPFFVVRFEPSPAARRA